MCAPRRLGDVPETRDGAMEGYVTGSRLSAIELHCQGRSARRGIPEVDPGGGGRTRGPNGRVRRRWGLVGPAKDNRVLPLCHYSRVVPYANAFGIVARKYIQESFALASR